VLRYESVLARALIHIWLGCDEICGLETSQSIQVCLT
jgi:hypothetical protein